MAASLTGQTPKDTYTQIAHFGDAGALPADDETPQKLYKGDGTETPISITATKLFVNGVEVIPLLPSALRAALGISDYADLASANAAQPHNVVFWNTTLERLQTTTL